MAYSLCPLPIFNERDNDGNPLVGGKLYTYEAGTVSTNKKTYDAENGAENTNPVILDSAGRANVWLDTGKYKLVLTDADDNIIWSVDNVSSAGGGSESLVTLENLAALRLYDGNAPLVYVRSHTAADDGGEGYWRYVDGSSAVDDNGIVVEDDLSRIWYRYVTSELVNIRWYGAAGNGTTNDYNAMDKCYTAAAAYGKGVYLPKGTYLTTGKDWSAVVTNFEDGAVIKYTNESTDCFFKTGGKLIGRLQRFFNCPTSGSGAAKVYYSPQLLDEMYISPEWFSTEKTLEFAFAACYTNSFSQTRQSIVLAIGTYPAVVSTSTVKNGLRIFGNVMPSSVASGSGHDETGVLVGGSILTGPLVFDVQDRSGTGRGISLENFGIQAPNNEAGLKIYDSDFPVSTGDWPLHIDNFYINRVIVAAPTGSSATVVDISSVINSKFENLTAVGGAIGFKIQANDSQLINIVDRSKTTNTSKSLVLPCTWYSGGSAWYASIKNLSLDGVDISYPSNNSQVAIEVNNEAATAAANVLQGISISGLVIPPENKTTTTGLINIKGDGTYGNIKDLKISGGDYARTAVSGVVDLTLCDLGIKCYTDSLVPTIATPNLGVVDLAGNGVVSVFERELQGGFDPVLNLKSLGHLSFYSSSNSSVGSSYIATGQNFRIITCPYFTKGVSQVFVQPTPSETIIASIDSGVDFLVIKDYVGQGEHDFKVFFAYRIAGPTWAPTSWDYYFDYWVIN